MLLFTARFGMCAILVQILSPSNKKWSGFSLGSSDGTPDKYESAPSEQSASNSEKHKSNELSESKCKEDVTGIRNKSKEKRNRRKERKRNVIKKKY